MPVLEIDYERPRWATPLRRHARFKGAKGGRSSGKSHWAAAEVVRACAKDPDLRAIMVREVQRSLRYSAKSLIESKIRAFGLEGTVFRILTSEIRSLRGTGVLVFQGMQDHTADSIKSLEDFGLCWVEEAHRLSKRSLDLLVPTIRRPGSELWFTWNPELPEDPVDRLFAKELDPTKDDFVLVHVNYDENPWCPPEMKREAERLRRVDPSGFAHIWLGEYNLSPETQVLHGKWRVDEFSPSEDWDGPYFGLDFGFSQDPSVLVRVWLAGRRLMIDYDPGGTHWDLDRHVREVRAVPGASSHVIRADSARPETINELVKRGLHVEGVEKWDGSVEDGILWLRSCDEIVIHERCRRAAEEARLWRYKTDRLTGDPLPKLEEGHEHVWDAVRYALAPLIREGFEFWIR